LNGEFGDASDHTSDMTACAGMQGHPQ